MARASFLNTEEHDADRQERATRKRTYMNNAKRGDDRRTISTPVTTRSPADWKPEPCGLTREQIRAIVIEQIG